jgi:hypothetical protein
MPHGRSPPIVPGHRERPNLGTRQGNGRSRHFGAAAIAAVAGLYQTDGARVEAPPADERTYLSGIVPAKTHARELGQAKQVFEPIP